MINKDKIIQEIYAITNGEDACEYMYQDFPDVSKHFDTVNQILAEIDLNRVDPQFLYMFLLITSHYINELSNYRSFYYKVIGAAIHQGYSEKRINNLYGKYKLGMKPYYNPNAIPYKSPDEREEEKLQSKIDWAFTNDKELYYILTDFKNNKDYYNESKRKYQLMSSLFEEDQIKEKTVEALRAMADRIESDHMLLVHADLPKLPIFSDDNFYSSIEVQIIAGPMGG
jgi:hypothetical protein